MRRYCKEAQQIALCFSILNNTTLHQTPGLSVNDAASIDHLPGLKSLKMRVRHWGTAPYEITRMG